jgi:hypothetical protein
MKPLRLAVYFSGANQASVTAFDDVPLYAFAMGHANVRKALPSVLGSINIKSADRGHTKLSGVALRKGGQRPPFLR